TADTMTSGRPRFARPWARPGASPCSTAIPAAAATPATAPAASARHRNRAIRSWSPARRASPVRYTAARYAQTTTHSTPVITDTGFHQLVIALPAPTAAGTVPRKNGVITEEKAKAAPKIRRCHTAVTLLRNANAEPRAITPNAAQVSGIQRVEATAPN